MKKRTAVATLAALVAGSFLGLVVRGKVTAARDQVVEATEESTAAMPRRAARATGGRDDLARPRVSVGPAAGPEDPNDQFFPRAPDEWQGMRVRKDLKLPCESSAGCNLGAACIEGVCSACRRDDDCEASEACAMDHCVPRENVECGRRADCVDDELCILTDYAGSSPRKNEQMKSYCSSPTGQNPHVAAPEPVVIPDEVQAAYIPGAQLDLEVQAEDLLERARAQFAKDDEVERALPASP